MIQTMLKNFFSKKNLFLRVAVGFALGVILGLVAPGFSIATKVAGDVYLNLIKLMIIPVVICAVFCGIANMKDGTLLRKVGLRTVGLYVLMFFASSAVSLLIVYLIRPGRGITIASDVVFSSNLANTSVSSFFAAIIPTNIFKAMADGNTLPIILFTAVFAIAVVSIKEKGTVIVEFMNSVSEAMFKMLGYFMELSPIGVMSLMAFSVASYGAGIFSALAKYIICCWICCLITFVIVMVLPSCLYTGVRPSRFLRACGKISLVTLSTTSSAATLPTTINVSIKDLGAPREISEFTLPLGCTINMCGGACSFCCLAVFTADIYGLELSLWTIIAMVAVATLMNMAAPGIPGGGLILGASFLSIFGLPFDVMALISGFYRLLDMAFTTVNVLGDVSANLIISKSVGKYS